MTSLRAVVFAGIGLLCGLQAAALLRAPDAWLPKQIAVRLQPGESVLLGGAELAAPQADHAHIEILRSAHGEWQLRTAGQGRAPVLSRDGGDESLATVPVAGLPAFRIGNAQFAVVRADTRQAEFLRGDHRWRYDGATLYRNGAAQPACPDARWPNRIVALWNRIAPHALTIGRPLQFGGNLYCGNRLGIAGLAPDGASMSRSGGQLRLTDTARAPRSLSGVQAVALGQTRFELQRGADSPDTLLLSPTRRVSLFATPEARLPAQLDWTWQQRSLWQATAAPPRAGAALAAPPSAAVLAAVAGLALAFSALAARLDRTGPRTPAGTGGHTAADGRNPAGGRDAANGQTATGLPAARRLLVPLPARAGPTMSPTSSTRATQAPQPTNATRRARRPPAWLLHRTGPAQRAATLLAAACLLAAGVCALAAQRAGHPPAAAISLLLAALSLTLWIAVPGRVTLAIACAVPLIGAGLLLQLELGLGAQDTSWLRYYQKTAALLAIGSAAAALWRLSPAGTVSQRSIEILLLAYAAVALLALAAQVLWGDETGVFDLQPVELAKFALAALTAHCLALRLGWREQSGRRTLARRWLRLIAPALLFLALLAFALVQVDDYSPLVLLLLWTGATGLAYAMAARNWRLAAFLACAAIALAASVALLRDGGPAGLARLPAAFYADRFQVWLEPERHPHTGQQLLQGAAAIAEGGLAGADSMFGLRALGRPAGISTTIPAVQDDFAPSFFLNRHGLIPALLLWGLQAGFLAGLLIIAAQAARVAADARNFRLAWLARFRCFALSGGAAFVFGHFLLSWGTNLAIFPVMGQPMSFLSAGGSHLLFFLLPLLAFSAVSAQSFEE